MAQDVPSDMSPEGVALWGFMSGRYPSDDIPVWTRRMENERNRVIASGHSGTYTSEVAERIRKMPTTTEIIDEQVRRADKLLASAGFVDEESQWDYLFSGTQAEQRQKWHDYTNKVNREEAQRIAASADEIDQAVELMTHAGAVKARNEALDAELRAELGDEAFDALFPRRY